MMRNQRFRPLVIALVALYVAALPAIAETARLAPTQPGDLVPRTLQAPTAPALPDVPREPVRVSWPVDAAQAIETTVAPPAAESRSFFKEVDADALVEGVALDLTAPGAVVRVQPAPNPRAGLGTGDTLAVAPDRLVVIDAEGRTHDNGAAMKALANADALAATGVEFPVGSSAFRLHDGIAVGRTVLRAPDLAVPTGTRYQIHVFEPDSPLVLRVSASRANHLTGGVAELVATIERDGVPVRAGFQGWLESPSGDGSVVPFERDASGVRATVTLPATATATSGLWQVHVLAEGKGFQRQGRAPFAAVVPSARLTEGLDVVRTPDTVTLRFGVETAAAGRYAVRGVLFGTDADGVARPIAFAESAAWLDLGVGGLDLVFESVDVGRFAAPFSVRDLTLLDQGRMGVLQRLATGVVLE